MGGAVEGVVPHVVTGGGGAAPTLGSKQKIISH